MKLKPVERTTDRQYSTGPRVSISKKGSFYVNAKAMKHLGIKKEAKIKIFQDEEDSQAWYIRLCEFGYAKLSVKGQKESSGQMTMKDIADKILGSYYHVGDKSLKFNLKEAVEFEGSKYFPLELIKDSLEMEIPDPNGRT